MSLPGIRADRQAARVVAIPVATVYGLKSFSGFHRNELALADNSLPFLDRHDLTGRYPWVVFILAIGPTHGQVGGGRLPQTEVQPKIVLRNEGAPTPHLVNLLSSI